jgi:hypothetical protein
MFHHFYREGLCSKAALGRAFTACVRVSKEISLVGSNQGNYFENTTACSKRTLKTTVATQLKVSKGDRKYQLIMIIKSVILW